MTELLTIEQFLYTTLSADEALTELVGASICSGAAKGIYPCVAFAEMSSRDINGAGATRIATSSLYLVRAIGKGNGFAVIDPIASRIDALLHGARQEPASGVVLSSVREKPFSDEEIVDGVCYYHRGGLYRILVR